MWHERTHGINSLSMSTKKEAEAKRAGKKKVTVWANYPILYGPHKGERMSTGGTFTVGDKQEKEGALMGIENSMGENQKGRIPDFAFEK